MTTTTFTTSLAKFADFYLATNGFNTQISANDQSAFFTALSRPRPDRDWATSIDSEGEDWATFGGVKNGIRANYSMLVTYRNKPAIWLKYLFQHAGYQTAAIKAKYGNEYQDFKLTNLKQLFVGRSLKARLKLSLIMRNIDDSKLAKKLLRDASVVEFIASFDVINNRFSLEPINKNSLNEIKLFGSISRVWWILQEAKNGKLNENMLQVFGLKITDSKLDAPKIGIDGKNGTLFISINRTSGVIWLDTKKAGLVADDQLAVKFEYMEPIVKKI